MTTFDPPLKWGTEFHASRDPIYLSRYLPEAWASFATQSLPALVAAPPPVTPAELARLHALKNNDRPAQLPQILLEGVPRFDFTGYFLVPELRKLNADFGAPVRGSDTAGQVLQEVARCVTMDAFCVVMNQKAIFNWYRPYQADPGLAPPFLPAHPSYPSGHSTQAHALALVFEEILKGTKFASAATAFVAYARLAAERREIAGVHFQSDTAGGLDLAKAMLSEYMASLAFIDNFVVPLQKMP